MAALVLVASSVQRLNLLTGIHKAWYERCAIGGHNSVILYDFPVISNNMADARTCEVGPTVAGLNMRF
jgi:hypothetical protein